MRARSERSLVVAAPHRALGLFAVMAGAHWAGSWLAYTVNRTTSEGVSLFPSAGVTVAALLLVRYRSWSVVLWATLLSELAANFWMIHEVAGTAIGSALSNAVEPALGAWVVLTLVGHAPYLQRPRDLASFIAGAVVCGPILGTLVGVTSTRFTPNHSPFWDVAGRWFVGDGLGVLVVGSLIMAVARPDGRIRMTARQAVEAIALTATLVAVTVYAFWGSAPALAYATLPVLGWAAVRFRAIGATAGGAIVALFADWATVTHHGLFYSLSPKHPDRALWQLQLFLGVLILTSLLLASQVSELEWTSRALRNAEATRRFQELLEASPDPVVMVDNEGRYDYVNRQYEQLVGRTRTELLGQGWTVVLPEDYQREARHRFRAAQQAAQPDGRIEFELAELGGPGRRFEVAMSPMTWHNDPVFVATLREMTERVRAEEATREALMAAEQATRAKSEFLAMMSHEIRTPMNGVIGMVDVLQRMSLQAEQHQIVATIAESAEALLNVINDILDFSKIEAGKLTIESDRFDLPDLLDGVTEVLSPSAAGKSVELSCVIEADVPRFVLGDAVRVRQVIYNLLGNAVKFTAEGSVRLHVERVDDALVLSVTDTGIGMTQAQQQGLFEAFVQAEQSTTRRFGGSGLGLAIVNRLVELMHGTITVHSVEGEGSTFTIRLPLTEAQSPDDVELPLDGVRVELLASRSPMPWVDGVRRALQSAGARVHMVDTFDADAVAQGAGSRYDVLYVTRDVRTEVPDDAVDALVRRITTNRAAVAVCERTTDGLSWLPHVTPVSTAALTGRGAVRAVSLATGRATDTSDLDAMPHTLPDDAPLVLVAEDHPTNRLVIRRQLKLLGVACEIAGDGLEALEMLEQQKFALLLADCHMPRLDGYELTRRIRESENGTGEHLPIIALTANALPSEAERCLAAGMDLVLTKPVAIDALDRALGPWLHSTAEDTGGDSGGETRGDTGGDEASTPGPDSIDAATPVVDLAVLRGLVGDDDEAVAGVLASFVRSAGDSLTQLDEAEAALDGDGIRSTAHKLLGGARTMGAARLTHACQEMELTTGMPPTAMVTNLRFEVEAVLHSLPAADQARG